MEKVLLSSNIKFITSIVFQHPNKENMSYIRLKEKGRKITMTVKQKHNF